MTIRLHVGENLSDPLVTPLTYFGDSLRLWLSGGEDFWEDAGSTDPCEDGDVIEVWSDQATVGPYDASNSNTPIYDDDALNSIGGAVFVRADKDALNFSNAIIEAADTEITCFLVFNSTAAPINDNRTVFYYNRGGINCFVIEAMDVSSKIRVFLQRGTAEMMLTPVLTLSDFHYISMWQKEGVGAEIWVDGVSKATDANAGAWNGTGWAQKACIGNNDDSCFTGTFMEGFVVAGPISDADRQVGENYLATKYNL